MKSILPLLAATALVASPSVAQTTSPRPVNAGTSGTATSNGGTLGVGGTADASTQDGGTSTTAGSAKFNQNVAHGREIATATDGGTTTRSSTKEMAHKNGMAKSMSMTHTPGEKPVKQMTTTRDGTPATSSTGTPK